MDHNSHETTPLMNYRRPNHEIEDISPIAKSPIFNLSKSSNISEGDQYPERNNSLKTAGLSPELRRMLVKPRNVTEADDLRRLLNETINLTRTAIERGIIKQSASMPDLMTNLIGPVEENALFKPFRRAESDSLSLFMMGLDLAAWEMDDINEVFGLPRTPSPVRIGVLNMEQQGGAGKCNSTTCRWICWSYNSENSEP